MEKMNEKWAYIPGYEGYYQVSNYGKVKSLKFGKEKILKPNKAPNGYFFVTLYRDKKPKCIRVHRLVWEAFNGTIPEGYVCNHINEDKTDNRLCNLNLMTPRENANWGTAIKRSADARKNGKKAYPVEQYDLQGNYIQEWASTMEIERQTGFANGNIGCCCNGKYRQAYGYIWRYKEKETA